MEDQDRAAFEQAVTQQGMSVNLLRMGPASKWAGEYADSTVQTCWNVWKLAMEYARAQPGIQMGCETLDERTVAILKAVSQESTTDNDGMNLECVFCSGEADYSGRQIDSIIHKVDCPTMLAREVLREMGTPLRVYTVTYDRVLPHIPVYTSQDNLRAGFTEDEVRAQFQYEHMHNVIVEYVKDL